MLLVHNALFASSPLSCRPGPAVLAVVLLLALCFAPRHCSADCPLQVDIVGSPDLARGLTLELRGRGLAASPAACCIASVEVTRRDHGLDLTLVDALGRTSRRRFAALPEAAAWIDSMMRGGL